MSPTIMHNLDNIERIAFHKYQEGKFKNYLNNNKDKVHAFGNFPSSVPYPEIATLRVIMTAFFDAYQYENILDIYLINSDFIDACEPIYHFVIILKDTTPKSIVDLNSNKLQEMSAIQKALKNIAKINVTNYKQRQFIRRSEMLGFTTDYSNPIFLCQTDSTRLALIRDLHYIS